MLAVLIAARVHRRGGPAQVGDDGGHLVRVVDVGPLQIHRVRRDLGNQLADAVDLSPAHPGVGVRLQRALGDDRTVALVEEVLADGGVGDMAVHGGDLGLLHVDYEVVLQSLVFTLKQDVERRETGRADADSTAADNILDLRLGRRLRQGLQVLVEGGQHLLAGGIVQRDSATAQAEPAVLVANLGHAVQEIGAVLGAGVTEGVQ